MQIQRTHDVVTSRPITLLLIHDLIDNVTITLHAPSFSCALCLKRFKARAAAFARAIEKRAQRAHESSFFLGGRVFIS